ncbi:MAG: molybdopterin-guanine dinucleotide biosynthesis protein B [Candidatus Bathyarchaeota archaeon]|nr:molybdopterin-guanine dinucleotide biosynthesis protein B [Candidatus Bathyarchaeota archaeon]
MFIVAVVGSKKSGKTTAVETLVRGLTKKGYKVATVKHIPETDFTIDTKGKDTWRHAKAGARTVISVAPNELTVIRKVDTTKYSLEQLVTECEDDVEIIILEGFKKLIGQNLTVPKIVAVKTTDEVLEASGHYEPILTLVGPVPTEAAKLKIPYVDVLKEPEKLVGLVDQEAAVLVERKRKHEEKLKIQIDERVLPLNLFVQKIMRNTILGMISTLKGIATKGDERISVIIESFIRRK